ncbi:hypothetical protein [Kribbella sp. CA-294648]|uniref:hypothetical protein n=1 Tax=Kribbella sp. CA-294648 TaxID=3239948 RepID=UPI003D8B2D43
MTAASTSLFTTLDPALRAALGAARGYVRLASPYISAPTLRWLGMLAARKQARWQLLTSLDPVAAAYGFLHLDGLRALLATDVDIRHLDNLHAKLFLTEKHGFAGSANLTAAGLGTIAPGNHELSIALTAEQRSEAGGIFKQWHSSAQRVTRAMILECERRAVTIPVRITRPPDLPSTETALADTADKLLQQSADVGVWIKAISVDESGWPDGSWISNSRRATFSVGDLAVIYSKAHQACTSVVRIDKPVVDEPQRLRESGYSEEDANRWRWVSDATCLLEFPESRRVPIAEAGKTAQSLQGGYCRMPVGGLAAVLRYAL